MRFEKRGTAKNPTYVVYHEPTATGPGRRLGTVSKQLDGSWFACRATGPAVEMVSSSGHPTRSAAAEALR